MNVTSVNPSAAFIPLELRPSSEPSSAESQENLTEQKPEASSSLSTAHESASGSGNYMISSVGSLFQNVRQIGHQSYIYASGAIQNYFEHHSVYQMAYKASKISVAALLTYQTAINLPRQLNSISKVLAGVDRTDIITISHFFLTLGNLFFLVYLRLR